MLQGDFFRGFFTRVSLAVVVVALTLGAAPVAADTVEEVTATIKERMAYSNENLTDAPDTISKEGSYQFWSSGGLMQWVPADAALDEFEFQSITPKHIKVIELADGQAAVAMYYSEGGFQRKGSAPVTGYLTRVTEVYVKEDGVWKVRAAHWSPVAGGSGTNQNALD